MAKRVLITGGAGFIGSHLADELQQHGYAVRVLDCLEPQVHGENCLRPAYLAEGIELMRGDIRDPEAVQEALDGTDAVFHFAAMVGVGQSMYQMARYTSVNNLGTAVLLEALQDSPVEKLVVASSMSIYGEGLYQTAEGKFVSPPPRKVEQLRQGKWELCDEHGRPLYPVPTPETKPPEVASIYALSKWDQERMCLIFGESYGIDTAALRFFNCYGPRQALSNPYTGVLAIFASRCLSGRPPLVYEDGLQTREAVHVRDVARACRLALESPRGQRQSVQRRQRASRDGGRDGPGRLRHLQHDGPAAEDHRTVPRGRHSPLLFRFDEDPADSRLRTANLPGGRFAGTGRVAQRATALGKLGCMHARN